jgi:hypothetical protein
MKHIDRLKVVATALSSLTLTVGSVVTMGAAVTGGRTLAQALTDGAGFQYTAKVGDTNITFVVDDGSGIWLNGLWTITDSTHITLTQILTSSNGGGPVTFQNQTPFVYNGDSAFALNAGLTNPHDPGFDIILCAGQSNMVGQDSPTSALDIVDPRVFSYGGYSVETATYRKITQAVDPLRYNYSQGSLPALGNGSGLSPAQWFAKTYAGMIPSNRKVLLVPVARSATTLVANTPGWAPGDGTSTSGASLYENAITQGNLALAEAQLMYPASRIVGAIWLQGEGDADWSVSQINYAAAMKTLIQGFRTRLTGAANMWFILGGLMAENVSNAPGNGAGNTVGYAAIDAAHQQVAAEMARCAYYPGVSGYQMPDYIHYRAAAARILGCRAASKVPLALTSPGADATAPTIMRASVAATATSIVAVTLSEPFDPAYPPQTSAWAVTGHTVTSASGAGNVVYLTVSSPFVNGEAQRTVTFTAPGNGLRDLAGNMMASQSAVNITNNAPAIDSTPPTLSGATVANATPATLTMTASESLDTTNVPDVSAFAVSGHTVVSVGVTATTVTLTLGEVFVAGEAARTVSYTQPGSAGLRDLAGNLMVSFSGMSVTNNAPASDTTPPTFSSAQIAAASPTVVQITMSETLGTSVPPASAFAITENGSAKTVSSVSVSGQVVSATCATAFSNGTTVQVTYTAPGTDPRIKDVAGNAAVSFGPSSVTNNVAASSGTDLRLTNLVTMTETSAVAPYAYKTDSGVNYANNPNGGVTQLALAGDGTLIVKLSGVNPGKHLIGFKTGQTNVGYGSIGIDFMADYSVGYKAFSGTATTTTSGRIPVDNDFVKFVRSGTTIAVYVSSDGGSTYTLILTFTGVAAGTLYCQMQSQSNGQFIGPVGTGWA